jgi:hypothetical protein
MLHQDHHRPGPKSITALHAQLQNPSNHHQRNYSIQTILSVHLVSHNFDSISIDEQQIGAAFHQLPEGGLSGHPSDGR